MNLGAIAGMIAACAFVILVGFLAVPVLKLGKVLDSATDSIKELTEHGMPILDEAGKSVQGANAVLEKADVVTTSAAEVAQNASALTALFAATVGSPLIKLAGFTYGVRTAFTKKKAK
ncbi:MAG: DUF948 domain-containing protein [Bifidobacteriaceae bacterium]|jgi:uncharacterized protein YoxC|nr:DUF948 domain-containing protein [Bifidobacteriaceae bacterium]